MSNEKESNVPLKIQGRTAFYNSKTRTWICADRDVHNGGVWKMFVGDKREGTFNRDLTEKTGK
jgi:hypothetical protein